MTENADRGAASAGRISEDELDTLLGLVAELHLSRSDLEDLKPAVLKGLTADLSDRFTSALFRLANAEERLKGRLLRLRPRDLVRALLVTVETTVLGLPLADVQETFLLPTAATGSFPLRHNGLTVLSLAALWTGDPSAAPSAEEPIPCVRLSVGGQAVAVAVSRVLREESLLAVAVDPLLLSHPLVASAALMGEGRPVFLLDTSRILRSAPDGADG